jgi:F-type H+-transporting ATPase subunit delta
LSEHQTESLVGSHFLSGEQATLARRYVDALYDLAEQQGQIDSVVSDLRGLRRIWNESDDWRSASVDPRLPNEALSAIAAQIARICELSPLTTKFMAVVAQHRRMSILPALIMGFLDLVATRRGEFRADIRTAAPLTPAQRDQLIVSLNAAAGGKVHLTVTEDKSLIGGMTVKLGSQFIDASVKTRLDHLERNLLAGAAA